MISITKLTIDLIFRQDELEGLYVQTYVLRMVDEKECSVSTK